MREGGQRCGRQGVQEAKAAVPKLPSLPAHPDVLSLSCLLEVHGMPASGGGGASSLKSLLSSQKA